MRAFIAVIVGGAFGFSQFLFLVFLDAYHGGGTIPKGDITFWFFAATWIAEMFALVSIGMCRISPWVARLLRDRWEAELMLRYKNSQVSKAELLASGAIFLRAILRVVDSRQMTSAVFVGVLFAVVPFVIPRPKQKRAPNQPPSVA